MQRWRHRAGYVERFPPAIGHPDADHLRGLRFGELNLETCSEKLSVE